MDMHGQTGTTSAPTLVTPLGGNRIAKVVRVVCALLHKKTDRSSYNPLTHFAESPQWHSLFIHVGNFEGKVVPHDVFTFWVSGLIVKEITPLLVVQLILINEGHLNVRLCKTHTHQSITLLSVLWGDTKRLLLHHHSLVHLDRTCGAASNTTRKRKSHALILCFPQNVPVLWHLQVPELAIAVPHFDVVLGHVTARWALSDLVAGKPDSFFSATNNTRASVERFLHPQRDLSIFLISVPPLRSREGRNAREFRSLSLAELCGLGIFGLSWNGQQIRHDGRGGRGVTSNGCLWQELILEPRKDRKAETED
mmetsp:Transcript_83884/g.147655  ORF Transcript_83884/g.147655 Transcript_83884/m.147655 type:complete len:309 (-) Transcript_83884:524-1450(-)